MKSPITTHVLDTSQGKPAAGMIVELDLLKESAWQSIGQGTTDADGRISDLLPPNHKLTKGIYRLTFQTRAYFEKKTPGYFYPFIPILFEIKDTDAHYHVPLLLNPFGYSTYRGS